MEIKDSNYFPEHKGIKPTSNRILVYRAMTALSRPVSLSELTDIIGTMDKSSVFRVLSLFASHNVVHVMEDGGGMENIVYPSVKNRRINIKYQYVSANHI